MTRLQAARRIVQCSVVVFLLGVPVLSRYNHYLIENRLDSSLQRWNGSFEGMLLGSVDAAVRLLPGTERRTAQGVVRDKEGILRYTRPWRGGPWSAEIFGLSLTDPLAGLESILASRSLSQTLLLSLALPVAAALLLGRVFCSWICPAGLLFEMTDKLRSGLVRLGLRPSDVRFSRSTKYVALVVGLLLIALSGVSVLGLLYPPAMLSREAHDLAAGWFARAEASRLTPWTAGLTWLSWALGLFVLVEITLSRRAWCRYFCPGGALYSLLGFARVVRIARPAENCNQCGECAAVCPIGLPPVKGRLGIECDNCGLCVSACEPGALAFEGPELTRLVPAREPDQTPQAR